MFARLRSDGIRYVLVGGLALVLHGHRRMTADVDLFVDLEPFAARRTIETMLKLGLRPRAPVSPFDFANPEIRERWVEEKGMAVFGFWHPSTMMLEVDLLAYHPIDFERAWKRSSQLPLAEQFVTVAHFEDLLALKRLSGRSHDAEDLALLETLVAARR